MSQKLGKIEHQLFEQFIQNKCGFKHKEVIAGPQFGVDVSIVELPDGNSAMALTSDPLSLIPSLGLEESAWLSVHLLANDMATTGYAPKLAQFVLNLPATFSENDFNIYWDYIHKFCLNIKVAITGGHTGFIEGQNSTIAGGGTFITTAPKNKLLLSKYAQPGNAILVTKSCAISSAAILAMSFPETVTNKAGKEIYVNACNSFFQTSSLNDALIAFNTNNEHNEITAMHDVTEGGVLGAIYELAVASDNGAIIYNDKLPIEETQKKICEIFDLDPRYCIGAGAMIIACKKESTDKVINRLLANNIPCTLVGELCEKSKGIKLYSNESFTDVIYHEQDPYWQAFFNALNKGWK